MKIFKNTKGITLVALVITIIVLLILAGISINLILGENGLLQRTTNASSIHKIADAKEQVYFLMGDYLIKFNQKKPENITYRDYVKDKLEQGATTNDYYVKATNNIVKVHEGKNESGKEVLTGTILDTGNIVWDNVDLEGGSSTPVEPSDTYVELSKVAKPGDYVQYVLPTETFTMTTAQTGYSANQTYNTTDYTGEWQVLYNDDTYGLQIVSRNDVTMGKRLYLGTENVEANAKLGYNNSVTALNNMCSHYVNTDYATKGRCVGSNPIYAPDTTEFYTNPSYSYIASYVPGFKKADNNYIYDYNAMKTSAISQEAGGIHNTTSIWYWFASRQIDETYISSQIHFCVYSLDTSSGNVVGSQSYSRGTGTGQVVYRGQGKAVRAVVSLKDNIRVVSGDGTKVNPYILNPMI